MVIIGLFCGVERFSVAMEWVGFTQAFVIDYFKPAMSTLIYNRPNAVGYFVILEKHLRFK